MRCFFRSEHDGLAHGHGPECANETTELNRSHREERGVHEEGIVIGDGQSQLAHHGIFGLVHQHAFVELGCFASAPHALQRATEVERIASGKGFHAIGIGVPVRGLVQIVLLAVGFGHAQGDRAIIHVLHGLLVLAGGIHPGHALVRAIALHQVLLRTAGEQTSEGQQQQHAEVGVGAHQK